MINLRKSSVKQQYKEFLFYLYLIGQIIRKKDLNLIESKDFDMLLKNLKDEINESSKKLKDICSEKICSACDRSINKKKFYVCENCFSVFHKDHVKHDNPEIFCNSCQSTLIRTKILGHDICLSSFSSLLKRKNISRIDINFLS